MTERVEVYHVAARGTCRTRALPQVLQRLGVVGVPSLEVEVDRTAMPISVRQAAPWAHQLMDSGGLSQPEKGLLSCHGSCSGRHTQVSRSGH
jgi:hypothetical protein